MTIEEKANRFDSIRQKAHELAREALAAGDEDAMLVFRCTVPAVTSELANEQRERLKEQTKEKVKPGCTFFLWRDWAGY